MPEEEIELDQWMTELLEELAQGYAPLTPADIAETVFRAALYEH